MDRQLDRVDQALLEILQTQVPLVPRPYAEIAGQAGIGEDEVLRRVAEMKAPATPIIRQISAIFDSTSLGYQSTLVAARVREERLEQAAAIINKHPGVSHNYRRNHTFNLWYTLAVPPDSKLGLEKTVAILHKQSGAESTRVMPTLRLFKIGVKFDLSGESGIADARTHELAFREGGRADLSPITEDEKKFIRILQQDLPVVSEPFAVWAEAARVSVDELLEAARRFVARKLMRRFSAVLNHCEAGISANAMGVWAVPPERQEEFGQRAAQFRAVSHCYLRRSYPDWPYTIFTMVHAPTKEQCEEVLRAISRETGVSDYGALYPVKEYKKVRVKYFTGDVEDWERALA